jgi:hypothetical protein
MHGGVKHLKPQLLCLIDLLVKSVLLLHALCLLLLPFTMHHLNLPQTSTIAKQDACLCFSQKAV